MSEQHVPNVESLEDRPEFSREKIGDYLAAFGNHEAKALMLVLMEPGVAYGITALHTLYIGVQGSAPAHRGATNNQMDYCTQSFEPIGAVAKVTAAESLQYEITEEGDLYGKALAGHLLDFSLRHPGISLGQLFSVTSGRDPDLRSPLRRLEIIEALLELTEPTQLERLAEAVGMHNRTTTGHIDWLVAAGLIDKVSIGLKDLMVAYDVPAAITEYVQMKGQKTFSHNVVAIVNDLRDAGLEVSLDAVRGRLEAMPGYAAWDPVNIRNVASKCLSALQKQGLLQRKGMFDRRMRSYVSVRPDARPMLRELADTITAYQMGLPGVITAGWQKAAAIVANPVQARQLIAKAIQHSPGAQGTPQDESIAYITRFLMKQGTATTVEISIHLMEAGMRKNTARYALDKLRDRGKVTATRVGSAVLWALAPPEADATSTD